MKPTKLTLTSLVYSVSIRPQSTPKSTPSKNFFASSHSKLEPSKYFQSPEKPSSPNALRSGIIGEESPVRRHTQQKANQLLEIQIKESNIMSSKEAPQHPHLHGPIAPKLNAFNVQRKEYPEDRMLLEMAMYPRNYDYQTLHKMLICYSDRQKDSTPGVIRALRIIELELNTFPLPFSNPALSPHKGMVNNLYSNALNSENNKEFQQNLRAYIKCQVVLVTMGMTNKLDVDANAFFQAFALYSESLDQKNEINLFNMLREQHPLLDKMISKYIKLQGETEKNSSPQLATLKTCIYAYVSGDLDSAIATLLHHLEFRMLIIRGLLENVERIVVDKNDYSNEYIKMIQYIIKLSGDKLSEDDVQQIIRVTPTIHEEEKYRLSKEIREHIFYKLLPQDIMRQLFKRAIEIIQMTYEEQKEGIINGFIDYILDCYIKPLGKDKSYLNELSVLEVNLTTIIEEDVVKQLKITAETYVADYKSMLESITTLKQLIDPKTVSSLKFATRSTGGIELRLAGDTINPQPGKFGELFSHYMTRHSDGNLYSFLKSSYLNNDWLLLNDYYLHSALATMLTKDLKLSKSSLIKDNPLINHIYPEYYEKKLKPALISEIQKNVMWSEK